MTARARGLRALRRLGPWLVGFVILIVIATRVPFDAFRASLGRGHYLTLALIDALVSLVVFCTDSGSTWIGLVAVHLRRRLGTVLVVRGATYLLSIVNYAVGQGGFGYYLYRTGVPAARATGATLFLIGTTLASLLLLTTVTFAAHRTGAAGAGMWWTLLGGCAAFGAYLLVIAVRPAWIASRAVLTPLFDAGIGGHGLAMLGRLPHITAIVIGHWAAMVAWGIDVPFWIGMTLLPAVVIASVLPISPLGLGTAQAAFVYFFAGYAEGATVDDRAATVFAFSIVHLVYGIFASLAVGLACTPFARRATESADAR